jgi:hypothetical protein
VELGFETRAGSLIISAGSEPFATLHDEGGRFPYFWPLFGPREIRCTRDYPMRRSPGEANDHPHHRSLWFAHGDVNGHDFWHGKDDLIVPVRPSKARTEGREVIVDSHYSWQTREGKKILTERREVRFFATQTTRSMDFRFRLRGVEGDTRFGDTKEGTFALRVHPALRLEGAVATGNIRTAAGQKDGAAWGTRAAWTEYTGTIDDQRVSVAVFDHPLNLRHPTWWTARSYGLFGANPFGISYFEKKPRGTGDFVLPAGEELELRYRILLTLGSPDPEDLDRVFEEWSREGRLDIDLAAPGALDRFARTPAGAWRIVPGEDGPASLELIDGGRYQPPHRSPGRIALITDRAFGDFTLEVEALQTGREYGHRDLCVFFGFRDPAKYYYVHFATTPDENAGNLFLVNEAPRHRVAGIPSRGVEWGTGVWHRIRIERRNREVRVFFDDLEHPLLVARDATHGIGHIGFGSFDDTGRFRNIRIYAEKTYDPLLGSHPFGAEGD